MTVPNNIEEILKRTFELEHELGVSRKDSSLLQALTDLQYLFVLEWCDPNFICTSKVQWAKQKGFRRNEVYQWLSANPKTTRAVAYLQSKMAQNQCVQLSKVIYQKGMDGDIRAAKLYLDHFQPEDMMPIEEEEEESTFVLDHKWENPKENRSDRPNVHGDTDQLKQ